jgi:hypothetical protein
MSMRFILAVATALVFAAVPSAALATPPAHIPLPTTTGTFVINDACPFAIQVTGTFDEAFTVFYAPGSNTPVRANVTVVESDVFSAHGKTLTAEPYHYSGHATFDANGQPTTAFDTGVVVKIRLPDGSLFIAAGRSDLINGPKLIPDAGTTHNLAGFCAALS